MHIDLPGLKEGLHVDTQAATKRSRNSKLGRQSLTLQDMSAFCYGGVSMSLSRWVPCYHLISCCIACAVKWEGTPPYISAQNDCEQGLQLVSPLVVSPPSSPFIRCLICSECGNYLDGFQDVLWQMQVSTRNRVLILFDWVKTRVFGRDLSVF